MSNFDAYIMPVEESGDDSPIPISKGDYEGDLEEDISKMNLEISEKDDVVVAVSDVSLFRKRIAEAQLTDSLSEFVPSLATETIDVIAEKTKAESKLFLDEMDSTLKNLNAWKGRSSAEDGDLMLLEERPETDGQDFPIPISHDDNVGSIRQYNCSPDMKEKLESLQHLVQNGHKQLENEAGNNQYMSKNLRVDLLRIDFEAGVDSLTLATAREREIMQKELEMDLKMSGLSSALEQAGHDLDDILGKFDKK